MVLIATLDVLTRADVSGLVSGMKKGADSVGGFINRIVGLKGLLAGLAGYFTLRGMEQFVGGAIDRVATITKSAHALGMGVQALSAYQDGAEKAGLELDVFTRNIKNMRDYIGNATTGNKAAAESFATLGVDIGAIANLSAEEQLAAIADGFREVGLNVQTTSAVLNVFGGRTGQQMIGVLARGSEGLRQWSADAKAAGLVFDDLSGQKVLAAKRALKDVDDVVKALGNAIAIELAPVLGNLAGKFAETSQAGGNLQASVRNAMDAVAQFMAPVLNIAHALHIVFKLVQTVVMEVIGRIASLFDSVGITTGWAEEQWAAAKKTAEELGETGNAKWWGSAMIDNLKTARFAADDAAAKALANGIQQTPIGDVAGKMKNIENAATLRGSREAYSADLKARANMAADPAIQLSQKQLTELQKINQGIAKLNTISGLVDWEGAAL